MYSIVTDVNLMYSNQPEGKTTPVNTTFDVFHHSLWKNLTYPTPIYDMHMKMSSHSNHTDMKIDVFYHNRGNKRYIQTMQRLNLTYSSITDDEMCHILP